MNESLKNKYYSPILYDIYGNLDGNPILVLEDIFYPHENRELENLHFGKFKIIHVKKMQWEEFPFEEKSILSNIFEQLEKIILLERKNILLLAEGFSSGIALKLAQESGEKISEIHLLTPIYSEKENLKENWNHLEEFWKWFEKEKENIRYFYKLPFLLEFFYKNLQLIELVSNSEFKKRIHFWLPVSFSLEESLKLQKKFPASEVNRIDETGKRLNLQNPIFQKVLAWKEVSGL